MHFEDLRGRLVDRLREKVRSGELTERGLARISGVSQPHIHNVLKGKKVISGELCDAILRQLQMDLLDLMRPEDFMAWRDRRS